MGRKIANRQNANDKLSNLFVQAAEKFQNWQKSLRQSEPLYEILKRVLWSLQFATRAQTDCVVDLWIGLMTLMRVTYDHQVREWTYEVLAELASMEHLIRIVLSGNGFRAFELEFGHAYDSAVMVSSGAETIVETMLVRLGLCMCQKVPEFAYHILIRHKIAQMISRVIANKAISKELRKEISRRYLKLAESVEGHSPPQHQRVSAIRNSHGRGPRKIQPPVQRPTPVAAEEQVPDEIAYEPHYYEKTTQQADPSQEYCQRELTRITSKTWSLYEKAWIEKSERMSEEEHALEEETRRRALEEATRRRALEAETRRREFEEEIRRRAEQQADREPRYTHWRSRLQASRPAPQYQVRYPESHIKAQQMQNACFQGATTADYFGAQQWQVQTQYYEAWPEQFEEAIVQPEAQEVDAQELEMQEIDAQEPEKAEIMIGRVSPLPAITEELMDIRPESETVEPPPADDPQSSDSELFRELETCKESPKLEICEESDRFELHSSVERAQPQEQRLEATDLQCEAEARQTSPTPLVSECETDTTESGMDQPSGEPTPDEEVAKANFRGDLCKEIAHGDGRSEQSDAESQPSSGSVPSEEDASESELEEHKQIWDRGYELLDKMFASNEKTLEPIGESRLMRFYQTEEPLPRPSHPSIPTRQDSMGESEEHSEENSEEDSGANSEEEVFYKSPAQALAAPAPAKRSRSQPQGAVARAPRPKLAPLWSLPCQELIRLRMENVNLDSGSEDSAC